MKTTTIAWLYSTSTMSPEQILNATADEIVREVALSNLDFSKHGYTNIGTATVEFKLIDRNEMVNNKVVALQAELEGVKAEAQVKVQKLEDQLNSLLAIEVSK
jgi:hypothetical protein